MKKIILLIIFSFTISAVKAQQTTATAGGDASGSGGSFSYSIGQVVYTYIYSSDVTVAQGVQQPYEISIILDFDTYEINLMIKTYPNPTKDYLVLNLNTVDFSYLFFELYDLNGRLIKRRNIASSTETIDMEYLPNAHYLLKINNKNKEIKTFKIIKN
jgi:hypothetical protein